MFYVLLVLSVFCLLTWYDVGHDGDELRGGGQRDLIHDASGAEQPLEGRVQVHPVPRCVDIVDMCRYSGYI